MKAVVLKQLGSPDNLSLTEVAPFGELSEGLIRVRTAVSGLTGAEIYARRGDRKIKFIEDGKIVERIYDGAGMGQPPYVAGKEGAGEVIETGPGVSHVKVGDRVYWTAAQLKKPYTGAVAEETVLHAEFVNSVPDHAGYEEALTLASAGIPAHYMGVDCFPGEAGDWAVVTTAGGAIGSMLTQVLKLRGVRVVGVVSRAEKVEACLANGCEHVVVGYENYGDKVRALIGGALPVTERRFRYDPRGAVAVYDGLGGDWWREAANALGVRGTILLFGHGEAPPTAVEPLYLLQKGSIGLMTPNGVDYAMPPERALVRLDELFDWVAEGRVRPVIARVFPMAEAAASHALYDSRTAVGKILISIR